MAQPNDENAWPPPTTDERSLCEERLTRWGLLIQLREEAVVTQSIAESLLPHETGAQQEEAQFAIYTAERIVDCVDIAVGRFHYAVDPGAPQALIEHEAERRAQVNAVCRMKLALYELHRRGGRFRDLPEPFLWLARLLNPSTQLFEKEENAQRDALIAEELRDLKAQKQPADHAKLAIHLVATLLEVDPERLEGAYLATRSAYSNHA